MARRKRRMTPAAIAASRKNLVKARAARKRGASSTTRKRRSSGSASITRAVKSEAARYHKNPIGAYNQDVKTFGKWSGGKIIDPVKWTDYNIKHPTDKKGRSNALKLTAYLRSHPGAKMPDPAKSLARQRRAQAAVKARDRKKGWESRSVWEGRRSSIYGASARGMTGKVIKGSVTRRRRKKTAT